MNRILIREYLDKYCLQCLWSKKQFEIIDENLCHECCKEQGCYKEHGSYADFQIKFNKQRDQKC